MPGLLSECQQYFHCKSLYDVLGLSKQCNGSQMRKAYYKMSLLHHPDRHDGENKSEATKRFQILSRVYSYLSDDDKRKIYDETGIVDEGDDLADKSYDDWVHYWQLLFPKVTKVQIDDFYTKYRGSTEELDDLVKIYNNSQGDMDVIMESLLCTNYSDEPRVRELIDRLIQEGRIEAYENYTNENEAKRKKRTKRAIEETKLFEKEQKKKNKKHAKTSGSNDDANDLSSLTAAIQARHEKSLKASENLLDRLTEKYCQPQISKSQKSHKSKK